jgi:hypothetical protein
MVAEIRASGQVLGRGRPSYRGELHATCVVAGAGIFLSILITMKSHMARSDGVAVDFVCLHAIIRLRVGGFKQGHFEPRYFL